MPLSPDDIADVIADAIKAATVPLLARIDVLDSKGVPSMIVGEKGDRGADGKDAEPVTLEQVADAILTMPDVLDKAVQDYVSAHPPKDGTNGIDGAPGAPGRDGKDADVDLDALALKAADLIPAPKDGTNGKDADPVDVDALALQAASLVPVPKDGASGRDGIDGKDGATGANGPRGEQGEPGIVPPDLLDAITTQIASLDVRVKSLSVALDPDVVSASVSELLRKELPVFSAVPVLMQKRIIRDAHGRVESVVDEPVVQ